MHGPKIKIPSIKNEAGTVMHNLDEILEVWRTHFSKLGTHRDSPEFSQVHFELVNKLVESWANEVETDQFIEIPFTSNEVIKCKGKLKLGKKNGADRITTVSMLVLL